MLRSTAQIFPAVPIITIYKYSLRLFKCNTVFIVTTDGVMSSHEKLESVMNCNTVLYR